LFLFSEWNSHLTLFLLILDMPSSRQRQTLMFSATFPKEIQKLASDFLNNYIFLRVGRVGSATQNVLQRLEHVPDADKKVVLVDLLKSIGGQLTLVFVETKRAADGLEDYLCSLGFEATSIHGDRTQGERENALRNFRSSRTPILVATDVCARGLDIPNVQHVINYDMPQNIDDYVHRIGRTGRAGNTGYATGFLNEKNSNIVPDLLEILHEANQEVPAWLEQFMKLNHISRGGRRRPDNRFGSSDHRRGKSSYDHHDNRGFGGKSSEHSSVWDSSSSKNWDAPYGSGYGGSYAAPAPSTSSRSKW